MDKNKLKRLKALRREAERRFAWWGGYKRAATKCGADQFAFDAMQARMYAALIIRVFTQREANHSEWLGLAWTLAQQAKAWNRRALDILTKETQQEANRWVKLIQNALKEEN